MPRAGAVIKSFGSLKRNRLINSHFPFFQRGGIDGSVAIGGSFAYQTADRWQMGQNTGDMLTHLTSINTAIVPPTNNSKRSLQFRSTHTGPLGSLMCRQFIEDINIRDLADQRASFGLWVRSDSADTVRLVIQNAITLNSFTGVVNVVDQTFTITNDDTWQFVSLSDFLLPSDVVNGAVAHIQFENFLNTSGTRNHYVGETMFNEGPAAAPWHSFGGDETLELAAVRRYYEKSYEVDGAIGNTTQLGARECRNDTVNVFNRVYLGHDGQFEEEKFKVPVIALYNHRGNGLLNNFSRYNSANDATNTGVAYFASKQGLHGYVIVSASFGDTTWGYQFTADSEI